MEQFDGQADQSTGAVAGRIYSNRSPCASSVWSSKLNPDERPVYCHTDWIESFSLDVVLRVVG